MHLDPDLQATSVSRQPGWLPSIGQVGAAQQHLAARDVGPGDVFLFFGWFRHAERRGERWAYVQDAPNIHSLFGWLQVGDVLPVSRPPRRSPGAGRGFRTILTSNTLPG